MHIELGRPLRGGFQRDWVHFLNVCGIREDFGVDFTVLLLENDEILATGSLDGATIKCIAVSPYHQGEGLTAILMTELFREAFERGERHLMLFTKPINRMMFHEFGFYPVIQTADCLLMENQRNGLEEFLQTIPSHEGCIGCIVANCNPFTLGHRYLIEQAASLCDHLHVFILSERKSMFSPKVRLELARAGCADLKNVDVHPSGPYMVSSATFPSYFLKDAARAEDIYCALDVRLFGTRIAPALNITKRFVGTEPESAVTYAYNQALKSGLPEHGIELIELERLTQDKLPVSASRVRKLIQTGRIEEAHPLVPESTWQVLRANP